MAGEDFIHDVDRSLREQRILRFVLPLVIGVAILILGGIWAWNHWDQSNTDDWSKDTGTYYKDSQIFKNTSWIELWEEPESFPSEEEKEQTLELVGEQREMYQTAKASITSLSKNSSSPYIRFLSTLSLISDSAFRSDLEKMKEDAQYFISDKSNGEMFRDFTSLYFARRLISLGEEREAVEILTTLGLKSQLFSVPSKELEAFALLSLGEKEKAREAFQKILSMPNVYDETLERAEIYAYNIS